MKTEKLNITSHWTEVMYIACLVLDNKNNDSKTKAIAFKEIMRGAKILDTLIKERI
tara:strand:+ start:1491 stop:1658 length:168 start_codon:yes stop_codon:yes gene_type:complete